MNCRNCVVGAMLVAFGCHGVPTDLTDDDDSPVEPCEDGVTLVVDWSSQRLGPRPRALTEAALHRSARCPEQPASYDAKDGLSPDRPETIPPEIVFNFDAGDNVTATPALQLTSWPSQDPTNDALYFATAGGSVTKLTSIYSPSPSAAWSGSTTSSVDGSAVALSVDGTKLFVLDSGANLHCFDTSSGGNCSGWSAASVKRSGASSVSLSSPFVAGNGVFYMDRAGFLTKVNATNGTVVWATDLGPGSYGSPVAVNGNVYVGADGGMAYRVVDNGSSSGTVDSVFLCSGGSECHFRNAFAIDIDSGYAYGVVGADVVRLPLTGSWSATTLTLPVPAAAALSSPGIDLPGFGNGYLYVHHYDSTGGLLFKINLSTFPAAASVHRTELHRPGTYVNQASSPFVWNPSIWGQSGTPAVYVGNGAGYMEQYSCLATNVAAERTGVSSDYGDAIVTAPVMDFIGGNINFGQVNGAGGGVIQITEGSNWQVCGTDVLQTSSCGGPEQCFNWCGRTATHMRITSMELVDPHLGVNSPYCLSHDVTADLNALINDPTTGFINSDQSDPPDGYIDFNVVAAFRDLTFSGDVPMDLATVTPCPTDSSCFSPPKTLDRDMVAKMNFDEPGCSGAAICAIGGTTNWPDDINAPSTDPTFRSNGPGMSGSIPELKMNLGGVQFRFTHVFFGAEFNGTTGMVNGLMRGHLSVADATNAIIPQGVNTDLDSYCGDGSPPCQLIEMHPEGLGGYTCCSTCNTDEPNPDGTPGWYWYLNFEATLMTCTTGAASCGNAECGDFENKTNCAGDCQECRDGIDNDGDGHIDFGDDPDIYDPECTSAADDDESM